MTNRPRQEIAVDYSAEPWLWGPSTSQDTPLQALMEAAPFDEPLESKRELQKVREAVAECLSQASDRTRFVINAVDSERLSFSQLGKRIGYSKSQAHYIYNKSLAEVRAILLQHTTVRERLGLSNYWNHHARQAVNEIIRLDATIIDGDWLSTIDFDIGLAASTVRDLAAGLYQRHEIPSCEKQIRTALSDAARVAWTQIQERRTDFTVDDMVDLLVWKQSKYGHSNILEFGMVGVAIRASDKRARIINLDGQDDGDMGDESVFDTLCDIVGYATIARMLVDGTFTTELEPF